LTGAAAARPEDQVGRAAVECALIPALLRSPDRRGWEFHKQACAMSLEGIVSKRADAPYTPGNRGLWLKVKCLHREEFVVVGWTA
jgi:ATP-dependent DNA ligase